MEQRESDGPPRPRHAVRSLGVILAAPLTVVSYVLKHLHVREALEAQTTIPSGEQD